MSDIEPTLDAAPGTINRPDAEALMREIHEGPVIRRDCVFFSFYMDAPLIVDWLADHGVTASFEQRVGEGVSIVLPLSRAFVGDHIVADKGWAAAMKMRH